jgi:CubicO group peptidase (beta-lactamase class C family)
MKDILTKDGKYFAPEVFSNSHKPGTYFSYCNLGFGLLGTIVEKVSGQRFDLFVKEHILTPLEIVTGGFNIDDIENINDVAVIYLKKNGQWNINKDNYLGIHPPKKNLDTYTIGTNALLFGP